MMKPKEISTKHLGEILVLNEAHEPVRMSALWREKTAVLVFVRHFG